MARAFTKNTSNHIDLGVHSLGSIANGAACIGFHCFAKFNSLSSAIDGDDLFSAAISNTLTGFGARVKRNEGSLLVAGGRSNSGEATQANWGTTTITTGTWYSLGATWDFGGDKILVYVNGGAEDTQSQAFGSATYTTATPTTYHDSIGCVYSAGTSTPISTDRQIDGSMAEFAFWAGASVLTADDFNSLSKGFVARLVRPDMLKVYMRMIGRISPEQDLRGRVSGTINGTVAAANHCRVIG